MMLQVDYLVADLLSLYSPISQPSFPRPFFPRPFFPRPSFPRPSPASRPRSCYRIIMWHCGYCCRDGERSALPGYCLPLAICPLGSLACICTPQTKAVDRTLGSNGCIAILTKSTHPSPACARPRRRADACDRDRSCWRCSDDLGEFMREHAREARLSERNLEHTDNNGTGI